MVSCSDVNINLNPFIKKEPDVFFPKTRKSLGEASKKIVCIFRKPEKPQGFVSRLEQKWDLLAEKVDLLSDKIGGFGTGLVLGSIAIKPITSSIVFLADIVNALPKDTYECLDHWEQDVFRGALVLGTSGAIREEFIFRGILQGFVLNKIPRAITKKLLPGRENIFDTKIAKIARIAIFSFFFSASHLSNFDIPGISKEGVIRQLFFTFFLGIGCGLLKESKAGTYGAMGAHVAFNIISVSLPRWGLFCEKAS